MGLNKTQVGSITVCLLILILISIILFAVSFSSVLPLHCAIDMNTVNNAIDETRVYYEGRHWLGLGHKFITYPMSWQLIDFSDDEEDGDLPLDAGTSDGQPITLEVSVFFSLKPAEIIQLYRLLGTAYYANILAAAKSELKNTASRYTTTQFFEKRDEISQKMQEAVDVVLQARHAKVESVLLRQITFSNEIENQIVNKVISAQTIKKNRFLNTVRQVQADTALYVAQANRTINEMLSTASATGQLIIERAKANATSLYVAAQSQAWRDYQDLLNVTNEQLIKLQWCRQLLRGSSSTKLLIGYDDLSATINP